MQRAMRPKKVIKEPVQVYLERADADLLEQLAHRLDLPRTEILRRGLRGLAADVLGVSGPALAFLDSVGSASENAPPDLAIEHDRHLADADVASWSRPTSGRRRSR